MKGTPAPRAMGSLAADVGVPTTELLIKRLRERYKKEGMTRPEHLRQALKECFSGHAINHSVDNITQHMRYGELRECGNDEEEIGQKSLAAIVGEVFKGTSHGFAASRCAAGTAGAT